MTEGNKSMNCKQSGFNEASRLSDDGYVFFTVLEKMSLSCCHAQALSERGRRQGTRTAVADEMRVKLSSALIIYKILVQSAVCRDLLSIAALASTSCSCRRSLNAAMLSSGVTEGPSTR
jgi:hypothetical protein